MRVLIIGTDTNYCSFLNRKLSTPAIKTSVDNNLDTALVQLKQTRFDTVVCCLTLIDKNCPFEMVKAIRAEAPATRIILICDELPIYQAMALRREGLYSGFVRPFQLEELSSLLAKTDTEDLAVAERLSEGRKGAIKEQLSLPSAALVRGVSATAKKMYEQIDLVGPTNFSVIIYGETGTGKESVANMISTANTGNGRGRYVSVDCGCLSKELALSELFGHEKGSFTGAVATKTGAFELAHNGTLFLDEIGNLDHEVQGYLLRALQERKIRRVGGVKDIDVSNRIIVASNEDLGKAVKDGKFREDLYHRLNEFQVTVPPLKERSEDIPLFVERFLEEANRELNKDVKMPDSRTMEALSAYEWPGNIRELRNLVRRACLTCPDNRAFCLSDLPPGIIAGAEDGSSADTTRTDTGAGHIYLKARDITLDKLKKVLQMVHYNKTKAAELLGIDRKTIYNKLKVAAACL